MERSSADAAEDPVRPPPAHERAGPVGWYDPGQLFRTAGRVVVSELFGKHSDRRVLDAIVSRDIESSDYSGGDEIWLDYVADTGDGWDPTYAVAYHLAQPVLELEQGAGSPVVTRRGRVLVFGGDQVYPTPSRDEYARRLVAPYRTALPYTDAPNPAVFAVAGNHDWYDNLVAFTRLFCSRKRRWIGGWRTEQRRSYFAVKLPHRWYLIGVDIQLESDIDEPQLDYFREVAEQMEDDARVILCVAEPHWIFTAKYADVHASTVERQLDFLEQQIFGKRVMVYVAGDLHHYRRHADRTGRQKITAGGGGAFLHPTHGDEKEVAELPGGFAHAQSFPEPATTRKLTWRNLWFPWINPRFGVATAVLYLLLAWSVKLRDVDQLSRSRLSAVGMATLRALLDSQVSAFWAILVLLGFYFFTDTHSRWYKRVAGPLHGLTHLLAVFILAWVAVTITVAMLGPPFEAPSRLITAGLLIAAGGYVVGPLIVGLYLLISLNVFGRHAGEFSSLRCVDYKSWLRLHIARSGVLTIYPIKIERVPRRWRSPGPAYAGPSLLVPDDPAATNPALIEAPVVVPLHA